MRHWFTRADFALSQSTIKRFEPSHWTVDFPRGCMASVVSVPERDELRVDVVFARKGDIAGLIFETEDRHVHVAHRRAHGPEYRGCTLSFRWESAGLIPLDEVNGPTLTIEGKDATGQRRSWYVRLWNYASGTGSDAQVSIPFDRLDAGYSWPVEAERVPVNAIDRIFISLVPPGFVPSSEERLPAPAAASVRISSVQCTGSGSVLPIGDAFVPEHELRICTAYDDLYHLTPERVFDEIERLGYRKIVNHYVGMSHYPALGADGLVAAELGICDPARRWHESFATIARERGFEIIWSLSFELLDSLCPGEWKQRAHDGQPAATGYVPPSTLLSPAVPEAVFYLGKILSQFVRIGVNAGLAPLAQVGEPWWWVRPDHAICIYDGAASALLPSGHPPIVDVRNAGSAAAIATLDRAGELLSAATASVIDAVRAEVAQVTSHLLVYLPSILRSDAPELHRANLPAGWRSPAFDVLQLEDYEWLSAGRLERSRRGLAQAADKLSYPKERRHYLAGFVPTAGERSQWRDILRAAGRERRVGVSEIFLWALPQVLRDGLTIFEGDEPVESFRDILFPLEVGATASVAPHFSTQIASGGSGFEFRNANWQQARLHFDVGPCVRSVEDMQELLVFFRSVRGTAVAFRFRDPFDFSSNANCEPEHSDVELGVADGSTSRFPLVKRYGQGEVRRITRPVANSLLISLDHVLTLDWALGDGGVVEFSAPPPAGAVIRAGFKFDVPVRFADDELRVSLKTFGAGEAVSIPLVEVREA